MVREQRLARIAGIALLVICLNLFLSNDLIVAGDAVATAHNIAGHERWFRIGLFGDLVMLNGDIVLAVALYRLLAPVNAGLALAGMVWRLANAGLLAMGVAAKLVAVDLATDAHYAAALGLAPSAALMRAMLSLSGSGAEVGLILFGLGAATHAWLLWVSRMIPRLLAGAYLIIAVVIAAFFAAVTVWPAIEGPLEVWILAPDFVIELAVALWLIVRGVRLCKMSYLGWVSDRQLERGFAKSGYEFNLNYSCAERMRCK